MKVRQKTGMSAARGDAPWPLRSGCFSRVPLSRITSTSVTKATCRDTRESASSLSCSSSDELANEFAAEVAAEPAREFVADSDSSRLVSAQQKQQGQ